MGRVTIAGVLALALVAWLLWPGTFGATGGGGPDEHAGPGADPRLLRGDAMPQLHAPSPRAKAPSELGSPGNVLVEVKDERDLMLRLDTVDARTGGRLAARWNLGTGQVTAGPFLPGMKITPEATEQLRLAVASSVAKWEAAFVESGERLPVGSLVSTAGRFSLTVRPPRRYVLLDRVPKLTRRIAADAREIYAVVPLWPEVLLNLRVLAADDRPVEHIGFLRFRAAGRVRNVELEQRGPGEFLVRKIPFFPGEPVVVHIDEDTHINDMEDFEVEEVSEDQNLGPPDLKTVIPTSLSESWSETIRVAAKEPRDVAFESILDYQESFGTSESRGAQASVQVRVLDHAGNPIEGAEVRDVRTDAKGELVLHEVAVGSQTLFASAEGRLPASGTVSVVEGTVARVTLREPGGARLRVVVLGKDGTSMSFARLSLQGRPFYDVEEGVQRLDMFTDRLGRRTFARVLPGNATLVASWGSRTARVRIALKDGQTTLVELRLASPKD